MARKSAKREAREQAKLKRLQREVPSKYQNVINLYANNSPKDFQVIPRNRVQHQYLSMLNDDATSIVFATGVAGSGKTYLAVLTAVQHLLEGKVKKIILTRPAVEAGEKLGFLPGGVIEKMAPWLAAMMDAFGEVFNKREIERMMKDGVIEVEPLSFMRGRSFKNAFIIADEVQNTTPEQLKMVLTRIGEGSKLVLCGDPEQHDRGFEKNGMQDFLRRMHYINGIGVVKFRKEDIVRHPIIESILRVYDGPLKEEMDTNNQIEDEVDMIDSSIPMFREVGE